MWVATGLQNKSFEKIILRHVLKTTRLKTRIFKKKKLSRNININVVYDVYARFLFIRVKNMKKITLLNQTETILYTLMVC